MTSDVSIDCVITCYNYADFVIGAIESALGQTRPYGKIIVVDDGSTDGSVERIQTMSHRVTLVQKPNGGHLDACLAGLDHVSAPYVHFLDADDRAMPAFVERMSPLLTPGVTKAQSQLQVIDEAGHATGSVYPTFSVPYTSEQIRHDNEVMGFYQCTPTSGNVFDAAFLRSLRLERLDPRGAFDGAACLAAAYRGTIVSINEPLAQYGVHGASLSNSHALPTAAQFEKEVREFRRNWAEACTLLGVEAPPFDGDEPLYVLERKILSAALEGRSTVAFTVPYARRLVATHLTPAQKLFQLAWICSLALPLKSWRLRAIMMRRSSANRPQWLQAVVGLIRHFAGTADKATSKDNR